MITTTKVTATMPDGEFSHLENIADTRTVVVSVLSLPRRKGSLTLDIVLQSRWQLLSAENEFKGSFTPLKKPLALIKIESIWTNDVTPVTSKQKRP